MPAQDGFALLGSTTGKVLGDAEVLELPKAINFVPMGIATPEAYLESTNICVHAYILYLEVSDEGLLDALSQEPNIRSETSGAPRSMSFELL
jgi:hypothetical protein